MRFWFLLFLFAALGLQANPTFDLKHLEVSLRQLGHELLLSTGDSSSRVLPLEKQANTYVMQFESSFAFEPAALVDLSKQILSEQDLPTRYIIEVKECEQEGVVYSFEIAPRFEDEIVPCLGREQIKACYTLSFTFPDLSDAHKQSETDSSAWYLWFLLPLLGIPVYFWIRQSPSTLEEHVHQIGQFQFNAVSGLLKLDTSEEELTAKETALLLILWNSRNKAVEREVLLHEVWGDEGDYVGRTLDVFISRLRKKLKADPSLQILNVRGLGYKLINES